MDTVEAKIITVMPVAVGNGAKFTATNLADAYKKENPNLRVALVDFDVFHPFLASALSAHDEVHGIDNLTTQIDGGVLQQASFKENMVALKNGVELLKGSKMGHQYGFLKDEHIQTIFDYLKQLYDVVIVVVSPNFSNIGTIYGLQEAHKVLLVARNNQTNQERLISILREIDTYKQTDEFYAIHNFYYGYVKEDIVNGLTSGKVEIIGALAYEEQSVDNENLFKATINKGLFRSKNKNKEVFVELSKRL